MLQSAWFENKLYHQLKMTEFEIPSDCITIDCIKSVRTLYYDEHCLECSAPACYKSCPIYLPRKDKACMRFLYGIRHNKPIYRDLLWDVSLKFRKWGKLEARINKGNMTVDERRTTDKHDRRKTKFEKIISAVFFRKNYKLSTRFDGIKRKKYSLFSPKTNFANDFLFQCYFFDDKPFVMFFEICNEKNDVIYKNNFKIEKGFNSELLKLDFVPPEGGLVRLFPENNFEVELRIFAADLIELKKDVPSCPNKKVKCVCWDLDNTVWNGVLAESEPGSLMLKENIAETITEFDRRGIIQVVVSKNDAKSVKPVLERLGIQDYFVYVFANWGAKSHNIYNAARILNIGVDTFALIDDSDFERREVIDALPCVRVYRETDLQSLLDLPEMQNEITDESKKRRLSYIEETKRHEIRNSFTGDNIEFIKSCGLKAIIGKIENDEQRIRSIELLRRTNQLNLSAKKYTQEEFDRLQNGDGYSFIVSVKDKYGDYGQVLYMHLVVGDRISVDEFAMSCRVAGKFLEPAIFSTIRSMWKKDIVMLGVKTDRNTTLIDAMKNRGSTTIHTTERLR